MNITPDPRRSRMWLLLPYAEDSTRLRKARQVPGLEPGMSVGAGLVKSVAGGLQLEG